MLHNMDIELVLAILRAMSETSYNVSKFQETVGNSELAQRMMGESFGLDSAIFLLTKPEYREEMVKLYLKK